MTGYNLHYFNTTGRAELIRLLFHAGGQKFTDTRINPPDWPPLKAGTPWGSLPYLEVDKGCHKEQLGQNKAIIRYVAHEVGLGGSGAFEQALVDSVVEVTRDVWDGLYGYQYGEASQKDTLLGKLKNNTLPNSLKALEKFIAAHGKNGFAVGGKLTTADLAIFDAIDQIQTDKSTGIQSAAAGYPNVNLVIASVLANHKVSAYVASRK